MEEPVAARTRSLDDLGFARVVEPWGPPTVEAHPFCDPPAALHRAAAALDAPDAPPAPAAVSPPRGAGAWRARIAATLAGLAIAAGGLAGTALVRDGRAPQPPDGAGGTPALTAVVGDAGSEAETRARPSDADESAPDGARRTVTGQVVPDHWQVSPSFEPDAIPPFPEGCRDGVLDDAGTWVCR
jgi:hypothetical protein